MGSPDYAYKAKILKTNLPQTINIIDRRRYKIEALGIIEDVNFNTDEEEFSLLLEGYTENDLKEARKINKASYKRVDRLKDRIDRYLTLGKCVFATLTFRDDVFKDTTQETRRRYVARYLKSISPYYVANIDYGKTTEREHYHAIIVIDFIRPGSWSYGFDSYEHIRCDKLATTKLSKYVSKLTNHAIKETTKRNCYIYSR